MTVAGKRSRQNTFEVMHVLVRLPLERALEDVFGPTQFTRNCRTFRLFRM
jgi:hypothetical protein